MVLAYPGLGQWFAFILGWAMVSVCSGQDNGGLLQVFSSTEK